MPGRETRSQLRRKRSSRRLKKEESQPTTTAPQRRRSKRKSASSLSASPQALSEPTHKNDEEPKDTKPNTRTRRSSRRTTKNRYRTVTSVSSSKKKMPKRGVKSSSLHATKQEKEDQEQEEHEEEEEEEGEANDEESNHHEQQKPMRKRQRTLMSNKSADAEIPSRHLGESAVLPNGPLTSHVPNSYHQTRSKNSSKDKSHRSNDYNDDSKQETLSQISISSTRSRYLETKNAKPNGIQDGTQQQRVSRSTEKSNIKNEISIMTKWEQDQSGEGEQLKGQNKDQQERTGYQQEGTGHQQEGTGHQQKGTGHQQKGASGQKEGISDQKEGASDQQKGDFTMKKKMLEKRTQEKPINMHEDIQTQEKDGKVQNEDNGREEDDEKLEKVKLIPFATKSLYTKQVPSLLTTVVRKKKVLIASASSTSSTSGRKSTKRRERKSRHIHKGACRHVNTFQRKNQLGAGTYGTVIKACDKKTHHKSLSSESMLSTSESMNSGNSPMSNATNIGNGGTQRDTKNTNISAHSHHVSSHVSSHASSHTSTNSSGQSTLKHHVALKKIMLHREKQSGFPLTTLREVKILMALKKLKHENIVELKEVVVGNKREMVYLVFEYCEHDMAKLLDYFEQKNRRAAQLEKSRYMGLPSHRFRHGRGGSFNNDSDVTRFTIPEVKCLMKQLLSGLKCLHDNFFIHRDIKMSNLLYTRHGVLKLCDFGLARGCDMMERKYTPGVVTQWYRAPELLIGKSVYGTAIDIWACGCIFGE
eukprot:g876.t1